MVMLACAGLSLSITAISPGLVEWMKYFGVAYILWLAWKTATDKGPADADEKTGQRGRFSFWSGFILQFVNVKIILYGLLSLSSFVLPFYSSVPAILAFSLVLSLIGTAGVLAWALAGAAFQKILRRHARPANIIMALLLLGCAVQIAV